MRRLRFALLNAAYDGETSSRNFRRELDADLEEFDVSGGELPPSFDYDAAVVTGSAASVYWDEEWVEPLTAWVGEAAERGLPALGICYGHQTVAEALGGRVADMGEYELGYREIRRTGDSPLLDGLGETFTAFTTHSDAVVELPPGAEVIAENDCAVQGFRKGHAFGVQFHPEYDRATAESITKGKDLPDERVRAVLDGITEENYAAACEAKALFDNFCAYVREVRGVEDAPAR